MKKNCQTCLKRLRQHLRFIYPDIDHEATALELMQLAGLEKKCKKPRPWKNHWNESDILTISYGDSLLRKGERPLQTLKRFLNERLSDVINSVHILPFYPWSSDDGFSVKDYHQVDPVLGDWQDIKAIAKDYRLMADLVVNHCSRESQWFQDFLAARAPGKDYFICADPDTDLSEVVRPRTSPLLQAVETAEGTKHVWCTFSHDQIDLNFSNPQVLKEIVKVIDTYLNHGITIFRLDAVAFLWKQAGTNCLNLPQTHELVRLFRTLIEYRNPRAIVITETNIPNRENLAYFGNANEAHMIYNFALPPLLLHGLLSGENRHLNNWLMSMPPAQDGTTYFNFIASHDGIGLRPVEGILEDPVINQIAQRMQDFGGRISWRKLEGPANGTASSEAGNEKVKPYEINISLIDALKGTLEQGPDQWQIKRFICAHAIMLGLEGIPALYIHSLLATANDQQKVAETGSNRAINRHNWQCDELEAELGQNDSTAHQVLAQLKHLINTRKHQKAFHPNATQYTLHLGEGIFAYWRQSRKRDQSIFCIYNISDQSRDIPLGSINLVATDHWFDLLSRQTIDPEQAQIECKPYDCLWLTNKPSVQLGES